MAIIASTMYDTFDIDKGASCLLSLPYFPENVELIYLKKMNFISILGINKNKKRVVKLPSYKWEIGRSKFLLEHAII